MPKGKNVLERLYSSSPVWAQNLGISLYGLGYQRERLGGLFAKYVADFRHRERWSEGQMQEFVEAELRKVLTHAFERVPHYSLKWRSAGLSQQSLERFALADLPKIPVTYKRDLVGNADSFVAVDAAAKKKLHRYHTSGSSGTPVTCVVSNEDHQRFFAAREARSFNWAGASIQNPRSTIGGRLVVPDANSKPPYYRYNLAERQVYFSAFHISPDRVANYIEGFQKYRPMVLTGYAHSHYTLARMMLEQGLRLPYTPTALILGSEKLTPHMEEIIGDAFGARAYEEYGAVEQCVLATECEAGSLHINSDFGIVEIVDDHDMPVPVGQAGRILCTGLLSETQPLIRYDIGDMGILSKKNCACGRNQLPVLQELVGRKEDVVVGPDGRQTVRFHGLFINLPHLLEAQVIQEDFDFIRVRVVAQSGFGLSEEELIRQRLQERLGAIRVDVERVDEIERTERGKFRSVISRLGARVDPAVPRSVVSPLTQRADSGKLANSSGRG